MKATQKPETKTLTRQLITDDEPNPFDNIRHPKKRCFLLAYSELGNMVRACEVSQVSRYSPYLWRQKDPDFAAAFQVAFAMAGEYLESELYARAVKPAFASDTAAIFLLKGMMPLRYGDRQRMELSGPNGAAIKLDYSRLSDEQLAQLEQLCALATVRPAEIEPPTVDVSIQVVPESAKGLAHDRATIQTPAELD